MSKSTFVQFALEKDYAVHTVPSRLDFSAEEKAQVWLTPQEYSFMKHNVRRVVANMEDRFVHMAECTRGLESKTEKGSMDQKVAVLDGLCAVILEQERQRQDGRNDVSTIRAAYLEQTQIHATAAVERGMKDTEYENEEDIAPFVQKELPRTKGRGRIQRLLFNRRGSPMDLKLSVRS
jgi:hypothetical protein